MTRFDCIDNIENCAAKELLHEIEMMGADTSLATEESDWFERFDESEFSGDEFSYDGALTSVAQNSVAF